MSIIAVIFSNIQTILAVLGLVKEVIAMLGRLQQKADISAAHSEGYQEGLAAADKEKTNPTPGPRPGEGFGGPSGA